MKILVTLPLNERQKERLEMNFRHLKFCYCLKKDVTEEVIRDAEVILGNVDPALLKYAEELKWLQLNNAGTEGFCDGALPKEAVLTNATGAYGLAISEHMIGVLFELQKKLNLYARNQREHVWKSEGHVHVIQGSRVLVIGMGDIGTMFAQKMKALGCRTVGIKRHEGRKPEGVDDLYTLERLERELPKADIVAMSLPGNQDTYHMMNAERLALMKENAVLINVGRGITVDTDALVQSPAGEAHRRSMPGRNRSGASARRSPSLGYGKCHPDAPHLRRLRPPRDPGTDPDHLYRESGVLYGETAPEEHH